MAARALYVFLVLLLSASGARVRNRLSLASDSLPTDWAEKTPYVCMQKWKDAGKTFENKFCLVKYMKSLGGETVRYASDINDCAKGKTMNVCELKGEGNDLRLSYTSKKAIAKSCFRSTISSASHAVIEAAVDAHTCSTAKGGEIGEALTTTTSTSTTTTTQFIPPTTTTTTTEFIPLTTTTTTTEFIPPTTTTTTTEFMPPTTMTTTTEFIPTTTTTTTEFIPPTTTTTTQFIPPTTTTTTTEFIPTTTTEFIPTTTTTTTEFIPTTTVTTTQVITTSTTTTTTQFIPATTTTTTQFIPPTTTTTTQFFPPTTTTTTTKFIFIPATTTTTTEFIPPTTSTTTTEFIPPTTTATTIVTTTTSTTPTTTSTTTTIATTTTVTTTTTTTTTTIDEEAEKAKTVDALALFTAEGYLEIVDGKKIKCCVSSAGRPTKLQDLNAETLPKARVMGDKKGCGYMFGDTYHDGLKPFGPRKETTCVASVAEIMEATGLELVAVLDLKLREVSSPEPL